MDLKSINKFISNFQNLKIDNKFHVADGVFFIKYQSGEIFVDGDWILVNKNDVLKETNYLFNKKETRIEFMRRLENFIDNWEIKFIKSIEIDYGFNLPLLKIIFDNDDCFFLKGVKNNKSYAFFKLENKKLYFDWKIQNFVLND